MKTIIQRNLPLDTKYSLINKHYSSLIDGNGTKPVLAVVPTCNHFWKMVTKDYYKCSWCDLKHYR